MDNFRAPTREDLHAYRVLISFLQQVRSLLEDVNEETERSIQLLKKQREMFEEQDSALEDFSSNLNDCEENAEHLFDVLRDKEVLLASAMKVSSEYLTAMAAHGDSQREDDPAEVAKFEQAADAAEACNG